MRGQGSLCVHRAVPSSWGLDNAGHGPGSEFHDRLRRLRTRDAGAHALDLRLLEMMQVSDGRAGGSWGNPGTGEKAKTVHIRYMDNPCKHAR